MKLFFIISSLFSAAMAQEPFLSCDFSPLPGVIYECGLTIHNPNGWNNLTEISGIHQDGRTNDDVTVVNVVYGVSTNIPRIICDTFPNLLLFEFINTVASEIDDSSFNKCSHLTDLRLRRNRISSITSNAFSSLRDIRNIDITYNLLTTLPGDVFVHQGNLMNLQLGSNAWDDFPVDILLPLENLNSLNLGMSNMNGSISQLLVTNRRLHTLILNSNRFSVSEDSFVGLQYLQFLGLERNAIKEIPKGTFSSTPNLPWLSLVGNNFTELLADSFPDLGQLTFLDISSNPIRKIHKNAFRGLDNLRSLVMGSCGIEELESGVFDPVPNLTQIDLRSNRLMTLHRNIFGTLTNLRSLGLANNVINALDKTLIDDALSLERMFLDGNLCSTAFFENFRTNRPQYLTMLSTCFSNYEQITDNIITEGDANYQFFETSHSGIAVRVRADNEIQIALPLFNFIDRPVIEIFIGAENNTLSVIRQNQQTDVVSIPTTNIIAQNQWNDFRITWGNRSISVFRDGETYFPLMNFTMSHELLVSFYGLRAVDTTALWSVQPFQRHQLRVNSSQSEKLEQ